MQEEKIGTGDMPPDIHALFAEDFVASAELPLSATAAVTGRVRIRREVGGGHDDLVVQFSDEPVWRYPWPPNGDELMLLIGHAAYLLSQKWRERDEPEAPEFGVSRADVVQAWLTDHERPDTGTLWAKTIVWRLRPAACWPIVLDLLAAADDDTAIAAIGAGPLEDTINELVIENDPAWREELLDQINNNPRFARALTNVWLDDDASPRWRELGLPASPRHPPTLAKPDQGDSPENDRPG